MTRERKKPIISIIAAVADNLAIGKDNKLLWNIPEDLRHFKKVTSGHAVIMGQKTFESLGKPLPNRVNIVLTRDKKFSVPGCLIASSIADSIKKAKKTESREIFFIGGGRVYAQALSLADKLYITKVRGNFEADTYFPNYSEFCNVKLTGKGQKGKLKYKFLELARPVKDS